MQVMGELCRLDRTEGAGMNISILLTYDGGAFASAKRSGASARRHFD
jgi:hypothetical protein